MALNSFIHGHTSPVTQVTYHLNFKWSFFQPETVFRGYNFSLRWTSGPSGHIQFVVGPFRAPWLIKVEPRRGRWFLSFSIGSSGEQSVTGRRSIRWNPRGSFLEDVVDQYDMLKAHKTSKNIQTPYRSCIAIAIAIVSRNYHMHIGKFSIDHVTYYNNYI